MLGFGDDIILGSTDGELLVSTLRSIDRNKIGLDKGTDTGSPYGSFYGSNKRIPLGLLFDEAIESDDQNILVC